MRGTIDPVASAWDDSHEVIYSTARIDVSRYFAGEGPRRIAVREVVGNTQQAIGSQRFARDGSGVVPGDVRRLR